MPEGSQQFELRPAVLQPPPEVEVPPLPTATLAQARADIQRQEANRIEWLKLRAAVTQEIRCAVGDLEKFNGEPGELNHFLKGGDRVMESIEAKAAADFVDPSDVGALKASLICRVRRNILNYIQADEDTPWEVVKSRLKKAYGGGRWSPEEDMFQMFRETKRPRQSNGQFASVLLERYHRVTEKLRETEPTAEVEAKMTFLATILKVQLAREIGKKEGLPRERTFIECAQELIDSSAREAEYRLEETEEWNPAPFPAPRVVAGPRRNETRYQAKERGPRGARRNEGPPRATRNNRREERRCHGCGKQGHLVAKCPHTKCFECGTEGHIARQCPYMFRRRTREEPMEVNAQAVRGRTNSPGTVNDSAASVESSEPSESEEEGVDHRDGSSWRKVTRSSRHGERRNPATAWS